MKRLLLLAASVATCLGMGAAGDPARAHPGGGRGWEARDERDGGRGWRDEDRRGGGWQGDRGGGPGWGYRGPGRRYDGPPPRGYGAPYALPRIPILRPGGYLPPQLRGAPIRDYPRFRLRAPPAGYSWFLVGESFLLVSLYDGQIFDIVVD